MAWDTSPRSHPRTRKSTNGAKPGALQTDSACSSQPSTSRASTSTKTAWRPSMAFENYSSATDCDNVEVSHKKNDASSDDSWYETYPPQKGQNSMFWHLTERRLTARIQVSCPTMKPPYPGLDKLSRNSYTLIGQ
jgi:hypothetical protein